MTVFMEPLPQLTSVTLAQSLRHYESSRPRVTPATVDPEASARTPRQGTDTDMLSSLRDLQQKVTPATVDLELQARAEK